MTIRHDIVSQLKDYRGLLIFPSVTDQYDSITYPSITVPLYIQSHPLPTRKHRNQEINTISVIDPNSQYETNTQVIFTGGTEPLALELQGFLITPIISDEWTPTVDGTKNGSPIHASLTGISYGDLVSAYIEGTMKRSSTNVWHRVDPEKYIDPYGNVYVKPKIESWDVGHTPNPKKQTFGVRLVMES